MKNFPRLPSDPMLALSAPDRRRDIARIRALLERGRLVTLTGPHGAGKSALALRTALLLNRAFVGGVIACDLSPATTLGDFVERVAHAVGRDIGDRPPVQALGDVEVSLAERGPTLLVLDGVDGLNGLAPSTIGRWHDLSGSLSFLVTARKPLGWRGERVYPVHPAESTLVLPGKRQVTPLRKSRD
jgi:predicted ATPase